MITPSILSSILSTPAEVALMSQSVVLTKSPGTLRKLLRVRLQRSPAHVSPRMTKNRLMQLSRAGSAGTGLIPLILESKVSTLC